MKNYRVDKKMKINNKGFTLIELLAIISILSIISVIVIYASVNVIDSAKEKSYAVTINNIQKEANSYAIENQNQILWQNVDFTGDKQYYCVCVQDLIDMGYFKSDVTDSYIKEDIKVSSTDYIYLERNTASKTITKNVLLSAVSSSYDDLCDNVNAIGSISYGVEPIGWAQQKTIKITYKLLNNKDSVEKYKYSYEYVDSNGDKTDVTGSNNFDKNTIVKEIKVDKTGSLSSQIKKDDELIATNSLNVGKIDRNSPTIELLINNGTNYSKSKEAIIKLKDNESGFEIGNYKIKYDWSERALSCNELTKSTKITISDNNATSGEVTVNIEGYTGLGKLYVCGDNISDYVGNSLGNTIVSKEAYLDNTRPTITLSSNETKEVRGNVIVQLKVVDQHSGVDANSFTASDVSVNIGNNVLTSGVTLERVDDNNYNLKIENYNYTGKLTITINENNVLDKAGNGNIKAELSTNYVFNNIYVINYNENGGSGSMASTECTYGQSCTLSANTFTRKGYKFLGWSKDKNATSATYSDKYTFTKFTEKDDITLYAIWKKDTTPPTCTISVTTDGIILNANDDVEVEETGMSTTSTEIYNKTTTLSLSEGTKYGFVKDGAGNTGSCSVDIKPSTITYTCSKSASGNYTQVDCDSTNFNNRMYACTSKGKYYDSDDCKATYLKMTYQCYKKETNGTTEYFYSGPAYSDGTTYAHCPYPMPPVCEKEGEVTTCDPTYKGQITCVTYTCSTGTLSGSKCYLYNQSSCPSGWNSTTNIECASGYNNVGDSYCYK